MNKNNHFFGFSLKTRVMLFMSAAIFLTIGVGTLLYVQNFKKNYLEAIEWRSASLAQTLAAEMRTRYNAFDWFATTSNIDLLIETTYLQIKRLYDANTRNHVTFIAILNQRGQIITHSDRSLIGKSIGQTEQLDAYLKQPGEIVTLLVGQDYHTLIPVQFEENSPFAIIDVGFPKKIVDEKIMDIVLQALFFLVIMFFTKLVLVWVYIKHDVYLPISDLIKVTDEIAAGNLQGSLTISGAREFSRLASSLSHMRDAIYRSFSKLEHANQEIKALIACAPVALFSIDNQGHIAIWTTPAERLFGWSREDVTDRPLPFINAEDLPRFLGLCNQVEQGKILQGKEFTLYHATQSSFSGSLSLAPIYEQDTKVTGVMVSVEDISERIERERLYHDTQIQLRQAQKMESVGRLAGGGGA